MKYIQSFDRKTRRKDTAVKLKTSVKRTASVVWWSRVPVYRFRGLGSILGATRFSLRSSGSGTGSTQPREYN
jgi:hypothetical protein